MKFFLILLITFSLYADEVNTQTALDSLILKAGITSLINDFEREKNITRRNSDDIEELKQNVKFLMEQSLKSRFTGDSDVQNISTNNNNQIELLIEENQKLKEQIKQLEINKNKTNNSPIKQAKVIHEKASLKAAPFQSSERTRYVYFSDVLKIENCNKYGWCKLLNKQEYIPKYKIRFIR